MKKRTRWLLRCVLALLLAGGLLTAWGAARVVAWARDLPNRVVIEGDAAQMLSDAINQSYHVTLASGDQATQTEVLQSFSKLARNDSAAHEWIQSEFTTDITTLSSSADGEVADLATQLIEELTNTTDQIERK